MDNARGSVMSEDGRFQRGQFEEQDLIGRIMPEEAYDVRDVRDSSSSDIVLPIKSCSSDLPSLKSSVLLTSSSVL